MPAAPTPGPVQIVEGYGLGDAPADGSALPWTQVEEWLAASRNYWVCTVRADGRPHAMPVWGLWVDGELWFSTDPTSVKGRNLDARPDVVVHLESGDEVCVLEGRAERVPRRSSRSAPSTTATTRSTTSARAPWARRRASTSCARRSRWSGPRPSSRPPRPASRSEPRARLRTCYPRRTVKGLL